jgi:molybdenum cofactor cytidylyltransferase
MRFEELPTLDATGAILAHSQRIGAASVLKKGRRLTAEDVRALVQAGIARVSAVRLEDGDLDEDDAARRVAEAIAGANLTVAEASTGRANLFAAQRGVLVVSRERLDALNAVDEAITLATLAPYEVVEVGTMVATVKIIPFAVPTALVERASAVAHGAAPLLTVAPFSKKRAGLVLTTLPGVREVQLDRAAKSQRLRMAYLGGEISREARVPHDATAVGRAITELLDEGVDLVLVLPASAIVDRKDVVPTAIAAIGGQVDHLGMPVDPGNLLLLGHKGATPIVGVPGCARSLKPSGFDWVLERLVADLPVTRTDIMRLGAGGLLAEGASRPSSRYGAAVEPQSPRVAALVLAAGLSRRMGGSNKLLAEMGGVPIVRRVVDALAASKASPVLVVVGHQAEQIKAALADCKVRFVENAAYEEGLGASLRAGVEALGEEEVDGALVALGDMPWIRAEHVDTLIDAFDPKGRSTICVPVHDRKRGHPVLWSSRHFGEMRKLGGDVGARALLEQHADAVLAVTVDDPAVHLDVDTPDMLVAAKETLR